MLPVVLGQQVGQVEQLASSRPQAYDVGIVGQHVRCLVGCDYRLRLGVPLGVVFVFSSRRRHTISLRDWSSDVCSSDLTNVRLLAVAAELVQVGDRAVNVV